MIKIINTLKIIITICIIIITLIIIFPIALLIYIINKTINRKPKSKVNTNDFFTKITSHLKK